MLDKITTLFSFFGIVFERDDLPDANPDGALADAVTFVLILAGLISVIMIIIGGYWYVLSAGDPQKVKKAKDTILYSVIGLVISISAWGIIRFVIDRV